MRGFQSALSLFNDQNLWRLMNLLEFLCYGVGYVAMSDQIQIIKEGIRVLSRIDGLQTILRHAADAATRRMLKENNVGVV